LTSLQLALKHRQNKSQRQRIIVFTCSPIQEDEKTLIKLAKKMKKNTISVDFIAFGDLESETTQKLEAFNEHVKGGDGSHLAIIPPGPNLLSDSLVTTPILASEGGGPGGRGDTGEGGGDTNGYEFGINSDPDPELAYALRMSLEEEKARQEKERKEQEEKEGKAGLEGIPEEQPLLDQNGEPSGSGSGSGETKDKKDKDDGDKMDTA
jgi:26S proteasome regulatory subunit N10